MKAKTQINKNIKLHSKIYDKYEERHAEKIYNPVEQKRLYESLKTVIAFVKTDTSCKIALDYGCGAGNLINHLVNLGIHTIAADVTENFLGLIKNRFSHTGMVDALKINGYDLSNIDDNHFDLVAVYSVLHHVPDYLKIIEEMVRVLKPGGVCYIDHEVSPSYWDQSKEYKEFLKKACKGRKHKSLWGKSMNLFNLRWYKNKIMKLINPRYQVEGDIHVWPDDHIEWDKIEDLLIRKGCEILFKEDYLLYKRSYRFEVYEEYKTKCNDMFMLIGRK